LVAVIQAWARLPEAIRAGILAMVRAEPREVNGGGRTAIELSRGLASWEASVKGLIEADRPRFSAPAVVTEGLL
jgi:hypothetical protein